MKDHNFRILLAEDSRVLQFIFRLMLEDSGILVHPVPDAEEAVAASKKDFDLICIDLQLPGMNGLQAASRMREGGISTPVFAFSSRSDASIQEECRRLDISALLDKPFLPQDLIEAAAANLNIRLTDNQEAVEKQAGESLNTRILRIIESRGYNEVYRKRMMDIAPRELEQHLDAIIIAYEQQDFSTVVRETHSLKGAFGALGLQDYHAKTAELHTAIKFFLDPELFGIASDPGGLLVTEKSGSSSFLLPGDYGQLPDTATLRSDLRRYFTTGLIGLATRELLGFIDREPITAE